uniref:Neuropeptide Y receptor n=2 Tax=Cacopsylla melanoneura TaxID=428564 RepID=A0A8D9BV16_9HEMI
MDTVPNVTRYLNLIKSSNRNLVNTDLPVIFFNYTGEVNETIPIIREPSIQILFSLIYVTIFVLGVFGNVLVCYVVFHNKNMHTVTNYFITNLALSDILLCVLAVPFTPTYTFLGTWVFGSLLCHLVPYAQMVSVFVSTLTLSAIAIDRFFVIMYPFQPRMQLGTCTALIVLIWVGSLLIALPYAYCMTLSKHIDTVTVCDEDWSSESFQRVYGIIMSFSQFIIPFCIIAFCYIKVSLKLNDRAKLKPGTKNLRREEWDRERKKRTNRMLIAMVFIFGFCWFPINLINLVNDLHEDFASWYCYYIVFFITHSIAMSSTCYNPLYSLSCYNTFLYSLLQPVGTAITLPRVVE